MSDFESKVIINIDAGKALANIKALQRQISDFHTSLAKGSATANIKSLQMQQSLINTINATGKFSASMKMVESSTQAFSTALEKNKLSMNQYFKYAGGASKSFGRFFKTEMDTIQKVAIERVKDLQTQYIKMGRDANGALKTIAVRPLALDMENLSTKTQVAAQKQQLLNQLLKQGSTNLLNFGKNTQWAGRQLMVGFTIPLGIFGSTAAKTFMELEKQAIAFKRVYGDTFTASSETDAMLKQIQDLSTEFTKYGVAVETTMQAAAKAAATGKMGADLLAQVTESTRLSVLGNVDQQQALETTISLTNAFGTAADELRGKINFLNAVENQTVTSIEDLTTAIPKAAPVVKQLGGNVEDLAFFLTAMREGGINASEGANALKSGLASLINPTTKASEMLKGFGINISSIVEANKGDVKGLVIDFAKALDTLDPLNRARAIEQMFGKFQFSRLSTLFQNVIKDGSQAAKVLELTKQTSAELGILAQRELNRISASPMFKFQKAIEDFKKELAPVGEEFLKAVTPIIQFGTDVLKAFNNLDGGVKQFIINFTGIVAGLGPIFLMTFGLIANGVANLIKGFTFVKNVINKTSTASTVLGETTDYMTQQQIEAAAVAASLEQVHNKLTQSFTAETAAVSALARAYQQAAASGAGFAGGAGGKGKTKKYANGVFSVPGPKGAGDIVPALLSPGEAVIPAKPAQKYRGFIKGMIAGNIPGFAGGTDGIDRAHLQGRLDKTDPNIMAQIQKKIPKFFDLPKDIQDRIFFSGSLTADLPKILNQKLKTRGGGVSPEEFSQMWGGSSGKLLGTAQRGGADVTDPAIKKALQDIENEIGRRVTETAKKSGRKITDTTVSRISESVLGSKSRDSSALRQAKEALSARKSTIGDFRTDYKNEELQKLVDTKQAEIRGGGVYHTQTGLRLGSVKSGGAGGGKRLGQRVVEVGGGYAGQPKLSTSVESQAVRATKNNTKAKAENTKAIKEDTKTVKKSTRKTKEAIKSVPAVSQREQLGNGVTRISGTDKNGKQFTQYRDESGKVVSASEASKRSTSAGKKASSRMMGGKLAAGGFAGSLIGSSIGGGAGDLIQTVSNIALAVGAIKQVMPEGSFDKGIKKIGDSGKDFFSKLVDGFKGLSKASKIAIKVGTGAVGVAFTAFDILNAQNQKQEDIAAGISQTLGNNQDRLGTINEFFGTNAKVSGIRGSTLGVSGQSSNVSLTEQYRQSDQFKSAYGESASALAGATKQQAKLTLESLGTELLASGIGEEQAQIIIDAIAKQAGKTDLSIKVKTLSLETQEGRVKVQSNIAKALSNYGAASSGMFSFLQGNQQKAALDQAASSINAISAAYQSGSISGLKFSQAMIAVNNQISKLRGGGMNAMKGIMETLNPEIAGAAKGISNQRDYQMLFNSVAGGVQWTPDQANALANGSSAQKSAIRKAAGKAAIAQSKQMQRVSKLQNKANDLVTTQQNLQETETKINKKYDDRINALSKINNLQQQISDRQKSQIDLAQSLSQGDVYGAARAMQDINATQAQYAFDAQTQAFEDSRSTAVGAVQQQQSNIDKAIQNIQNQVVEEQKVYITIDSYLPKGTTLSTTKPTKADGNMMISGFNTPTTIPGVGTINGNMVFSSNIPKKHNGGLVMPKTTIPKFHSGGEVPSILQSGEFVFNQKAVKRYGLGTMKSMNNGTYSGGSVYNSYEVNVNLNGSNISANEVANIAVREIKKLDSQRIRSTNI